MSGPLNRTVTENFGALGVQFVFNFTGIIGSLDITNTDTTAPFVSETVNPLYASDLTLSKSGVFEANFSGYAVTNGATVDVGLTSAPEPSSLLLLGTGCTALAGFARRRYAISRS